MNNELLCRSFKQVSRNIWNNYGEFYEHSFNVGEETITETTLIDLVRKMPKLMLSQKFSNAILPFNKIEERENGADFEWYIIDGEKWIKFLVQAKKLKFVKQRKVLKKYYNLKREYDDKTTQCQNLIYNAWEKGFIPIYCFYNFFDINSNKNLLPMSDNYKFPIDYELMGWTYCYADRIYKDERDKTFEELSPYIQTVSSLFCSDKSIDEIIQDYTDDDGGGDGGITLNKPPNGNGGNGGVMHKPQIKSKDLNSLPEYVKKMLDDSGVDVGNYGKFQAEDAKPQSSSLVAVTIRVPVSGGDKEEELEQDSAIENSNPRRRKRDKVKESISVV